ncbi:putative protease Do-like 14 [Mercurialis annua]|uniref:putative protease Do-like 14 n=1 Tax=Mercurialis annua TaxID=3986 RepID=UPI00215F95BF|nr:putative protease Do-like 14 [Mercurialis annua]XP_050220571.1 putative protease Do-like 14 [Mercurialis annua]
MAPINLWRLTDDYLHLSGNSISQNSFHSRFTFLEYNTYTDLSVKNAALAVAPSVVSIIFSSGEEKFFWASGVVIECDNVNGAFVCVILTSASPLRLDAYKNCLPGKFKVEVILPGGDLCCGDIIAYDQHFNICAIEIESTAPLPTANLRCLDDSITFDGSSGHSSLEKKTFELRPHSNLFKVFPGDTLVALGRFHGESFEIMTAPGKFSVESCRLDCEELLRVNCITTKCGIGGPMINLYGEVVGINFYAQNCTPFLPTNVVCKWWEHLKRCREYDPPLLGIQVKRLFAAVVDKVEKIVREFPDISNGVIVEKVTPGSPAALAGICPNDVIVELGGKDVRSCLELFEMIWDKAGKRVDLVLLRASNSARLGLSMVVGAVHADQLHSWPLPEERDLW